MVRDKGLLFIDLRGLKTIATPAQAEHIIYPTILNDVIAITMVPLQSQPIGVQVDILNLNPKW